MRAGRLNKRIVVQQKTPAIDEFEGTVYGWSTFATAWARVVHLKGRELVAAQAAKSEITTKFNLRYMAGLSSEMRILYNGVAYDIEFIDDVDEAHRELWIMAKAGRSEG